MKSVGWRLFWISGLVVACVLFLIPRDVEQRTYDPESGRMREDTVRRVPIRLGLDLRGGIHLALEVDPSKAAVADCADAIRRAERVIRTRIDEFGTSEPVVQVVGDCRLIVELPGVTDPVRAKTIVQRTAFLEFRIVDADDEFRQALPSIDAALRRAGVGAPAGSVGATPLLPDTEAAPADRALAGESSRAGSLSDLLLPGQIPGEFLVPESAVAVVESLLARPEVQRLVPRRIELKWSAQTVSADGGAYRPLYAVESRPIITGEQLQEAWCCS